jgi:hypothetical protein
LGAQAASLDVLESTTYNEKVPNVHFETKIKKQGP